VRVLAIVHQADAGPGVFIDPIRATGAELHAWQLPGDGPPWCDPRDYDAVLTCGGAMHPDQDDQHPWLAEEKALLVDLLARGVPLLGVGLGAQLIADAAGAPARRASEPEIGWYTIQLTGKGSHDSLLGSLPSEFDALEWHRYEFRPPPGAIRLAHSANCLQAYRVGDMAWGIQFHAEVTLEDFESWLTDDQRRTDLVRLELEADELRKGTRVRIAHWNELGRALCERFLAVAATRSSRRFRLGLLRRERHTQT
jgi:GMP synthase-like glutamine amidotransferase